MCTCTGVLAIGHTWTNPCAKIHNIHNISTLLQAQVLNFNSKNPDYTYYCATDHRQCHTTEDKKMLIDVDRQQIVEIKIILCNPGEDMFGVYTKHCSVDQCQKT